jgi:hypothetical protein
VSELSGGQQLQLTIASLLGTILGIVPGAWIARTTLDTAKFECGSQRGRGDCLDACVRSEFADYAGNAHVLTAGQEVEGNVVNGCAPAQSLARRLRRWCHAGVIQRLPSRRFFTGDRWFGAVRLVGVAAVVRTPFRLGASPAPRGK